MVVKRVASGTASVLALSGMMATPSLAQSLSDLDGNAFLYHPPTNQFLGAVSSNRYNDDSICNPYGAYGNRYSDLSVLDRYGPYGDRYSETSAFNPRASEPPVLVLANGQVLAILTKNRNFRHSIDPGALFGAMCDQR